MPFPPSLVSFCGRPGAERSGQVVPKLEESGVEHLENAADVTRTLAIEIELPGGSVEILRVGAGAFAVEKFHRHESVEEVSDPTRMQAEFLAQIGSGQPTMSKDGKDLARRQSTGPWNSKSQKRFARLHRARAIDS